MQRYIKTFTDMIGLRKYYCSKINKSKKKRGNQVYLKNA